MTRFWFQFKKLPHEDLPMGIGYGCGVTAMTKDDAIGIIQKKVFKGEQIPQIEICKENVDVSTLDKGHVIPNMGNVFKQGVWFPLGYD